MLEKPDLADERIAACLRDEYGLAVRDIAFLPLGADANTAVYRVADDASTYFLKLRSGVFDATTVAVPRLLHEQGNPHIINPIDTRDGRLWTRLEEYAVTLFPLVAGRGLTAWRAAYKPTRPTSPCVTPTSMPPTCLSMLRAMSTSWTGTRCCSPLRSAT